MRMISGMQHAMARGIDDGGLSENFASEYELTATHALGTCGRV